MRIRLLQSIQTFWHSQYQGFVCAWLVLMVMAGPVSAKQSLLVMGDSLSAAYNLPASQGWVALTASGMKKTHPNWQVVNASVSGETSAGGLSRLPAALKQHKPRLVIIELGANDGLRGLPLLQTRHNLQRMIQLSKQSGAKVLLIGIQMPPNYGPAYTKGFAAIFPELAKQEKTALLPFLLEPIALSRAYFLPDQLHPNPQGQIKIRDHVWPVLKPLL